MNEQIKPIEQKKIKEFQSFDEIPKDPKLEGLRPGERYAGGDPEELIIVNGKKYKKVPAYMLERGPCTEKQYFSHEFRSPEGKGEAGPGWDSHQKYIWNNWGLETQSEDGYLPNVLSDLPLFRLVPIDDSN